MKIKIQIPEKLEPFVDRHKRFKVAYGGRGAAKSMSFANLLSMRANYGALVGCFREFQTSIDDSVYALLDAQIKKLAIPGFNVMKTQIDHKSGGGFRFRGLARSIEAVKSMYGFKYFWIEEGQFISEDSLKILTPTLREEDSELWVSANALNSADPFAQRFIIPYQKQLDKYGFYEDDLHYIVKINYSDNEWFPPNLEQERLHDFKNLSRAMYDHVWEGAFNDTVDDAIISTEWFDAAVDAHLKMGFKPRGAIVVAHDPSDLGTDAKGLVVRQGNVILEATERAFGDVNEGLDWAIDNAIENRADLFVWDADGLGLGLKRQVAEAFKGKKIDYRAFHGQGEKHLPKEVYEPVEGDKQKPRTNENYFYNRRAQRYWGLRDRFYRTWLAIEKKQWIDPDKLISISSTIQDLPLLRSELCRIPRKYNSRGMIQILSKPEMKKLKIQSPNVSDSVMMSEEMPDPAITTEPIVFTTHY